MGTGPGHRPQHLALYQLHKLIKPPRQIIGVGIHAVGVELREGGDGSGHGKRLFVGVEGVNKYTAPGGRPRGKAVQHGRTPVR